MPLPSDHLTDALWRMAHGAPEPPALAPVPSTPSPKGLAALHPDRQREIATQGGRALYEQRGRKHMAKIGRKGGKSGGGSNKGNH